ncbi:inositol 5-phosphatase-like protein [Corynespora cassiicola Philippines]|uniref:Inositol 5-phosphatase-like protein n=1 Tax=Corynespora cassiicola Philippines TaxID=1448308 RepID=A0A2T2N3H7_CORCC|nr:inositol 5-phosphatase-like protein [Corynespora cassiicola Philippines]
MFDLYLVTFNCARNQVSPESLAPVLFDALPKAAPVPDVVAISLQEIAPIAYSFLGGSYLSPYFDRVTDTVRRAADLHSHGSELLDHVATRSLGMTALMLFAKPQFASRIQWIQSAGAGVGFWNMGNKGAVAMRIGVSCPDSDSDDTLNLTFTAAHLAPMESNIDARNSDWEHLVRNLVFLNSDSSGYSSSEEVPLLSSSVPPPPENSTLFAPGNHLFFAGDLNYRTHDRPPGPNDYKDYPQAAAPDSSAAHFSHLLKSDQLTREKDANRTLHGLHELPIHFPPTYKYSMRRHRDHQKPPIARSASDSDGEEEWTWAKHRFPSWCDRILFLPASSSPGLEPQIYTALPVQHTSDHRPVALSVRVEDRPLPRDAGAPRPKSPFSVNPDWRVRRDTARRWEVVVGVLSYLALTKKGNAIVVAVAGVAVATWWLSAWLGR